MEVERRDSVIVTSFRDTTDLREDIVKEGKSFQITQREVLDAYKAVRANKGAGGVDRVEFEDFEKNWKNRLYVLWNRMASGSYFPKPVRGVKIPKKNGKLRLLGIPTIEDRVAQMVLRNKLEPLVEPIFADDSYGYRAHKSAIEAVGKARERCFRMQWVIEFDIKGMFDNINHENLMKLVRHHLKEKWACMYIERCLKCSIVMPDGEEMERKTGTPQGGVISPVLANLYMHYAFDRWITRNFPMCKWERYADDGLIHCVSRKQAEYLLDMLKRRMEICGLEIHPDKSKVIYCGNGKQEYENNEHGFIFLGYCFRHRLAKSRDGVYFRSFTPAVSKEASKSFREKIRSHTGRKSTSNIIKLAEILNPIIRGWYNYYRHYCPSEAGRTGMNYINLVLIKWIQRKRKKAKQSRLKAKRLIYLIYKSSPDLFYHWRVGYVPVKG